MIEPVLLHAARRLRGRNEPFASATVVRVRGSAYRRPGARMLITRDGWSTGSVSGGCLEGDVVRRSWWLTEHAPSIVTYDSRITDDDDPDELRVAFGLGCGGVVDVLLERFSPDKPDVFALADAWSHQQLRGAIATSLDPESLGVRYALSETGERIGAPDAPIAAALEHALAFDETSVQTIAGRELLIESLRPAPRLFVFGAGHDVVPLVYFARRLGWEIVVCVRHGRHAVRERFADADAIEIGTPREIAPVIAASSRALAVVMSHDFENDAAALAMLLESKAQYIGVLGPRSRTDRLLGVRPRDTRLHAPVGLELGAETPDEIALSIVSEIQATLTRKPAISLRERIGPIHASARP